jgi:hypothetical protein
MFKSKLHAAVPENLGCDSDWLADVELSRREGVHLGITARSVSLVPMFTNSRKR